MKNQNSSESKMSQVQMLEQTLQNYSLQKQSLTTKILEIDSAVEELSINSDSYKIIGNIMVKVKSEDLKKSLLDEKEKNQIRIKTIEKQESSITDRANKLQQEIMKELQES